MLSHRCAEWLSKLVDPVAVEKFGGHGDHGDNERHCRQCEVVVGLVLADRVQQELKATLATEIVHHMNKAA